jgi:hypothetical protein
MFECYNLLAPMEWGAANFWGWSTTRQLQDPTVTSLNFHSLFFEKLSFPTMSKTAKFGKRTQRILGVKHHKVLNPWPLGS